MKTLQDNLTIKSLALFAATLLLILNLLNSTNAKAQCHIDDWTALKALYESTNGNGWDNKTGWTAVNGILPLVNCNLENLHGVTLHTTAGNAFGRVKTLYLTTNYLTGTIPEEIGNLTYLEGFGLGANFLTGEIPNSIGNLIHLTRIYLHDDGSFHDDGTPGNNNLTGSIPPSIGNLINLEEIMLQHNSLSGEIPDSIEYLTSLTKLFLYKNKLSGNIPTGICNLTSLIELKLPHNKLEGNIPNCLGHPTNGNLSSLEHFDVTSNKLSGIIPPNIGNLTSLTHLVFSSNKLTGSIPTSIGNLVNMHSFGISANFIDGEIPDTLGNLNVLQKLWMNNNNLSGSIPTRIGNLSQLSTVYLQGNNLSGSIPAFSSSSINLYINENYFSCSEIENGLMENQIPFEYDPQFKSPENYDEQKSFVIDSVNIGQTTVNLTPNFSGNINGYSYQWRQNDVVISGATDATLTIPNVQPDKAGKYTLHIEDSNCQSMELISDPFYVLIEGYDLYGQEVEYNQIMVEFDNLERTNYYEEILLEGKGWVEKRCNCNRELYLWEFQSTEDAVDALVAIDAKHVSIKPKPKVDGGLNNYVTIGDSNFGAEAFNILRNVSSTTFPDQVTVFLLDTGLDQNGIDASPYLMTNAPVDNCYEVNSASGYNYINDSIDIDYSDEVWHGTFGFNAITSALDESNNVEIVPLKVFDENGQGSLFDLTCAIYHAIDHNADIINLSAGYQGQHSSILENAVNYARENGIFICTAAGNDTLNIDSIPQYPAYFASQYYHVYDEIGQITESFKYDNVISVASLDAQNNLSAFSNYGQDAVTISSYGEDIHSYGLGGTDMFASGSSMATYFVTRELALEIASNKNRSYQQIWNDFTNNCLIDNPSTVDKTITGKQLNVPIEPIVYGCTDEESCNYNELATIDNGNCEPCNTGPTCNSNARLANPIKVVVEGAFAKFAQRSFTNNFIIAEKAYIKHQKEIHRILSSADKRYVKVNANFQVIKDIALSLLYQTFTNTKNETIVNKDHLQKIDNFFTSLHKATDNQNLKKEIDDIRRYLHVMKDKELQQALIDFDKAGLEDMNQTMEDNLLSLQESFTVQLINTLGRDAYIIYQASHSGTVNIQLFDVDGRKLQQSFSQTIESGKYQRTLFKQHLPKGIYYAQIYFKSVKGEVFKEVLKVSVVQ